MRVSSTDISCGIDQLVDIGYEPTQAEYDNAMTDPEAAMIIASLTTKQKRGLKLLKKNGFTRVGRSKLNPNSGNDIVLLVKRVNRSKGR